MKRGHIIRLLTALITASIVISCMPIALGQEPVIYNDEPEIAEPLTPPQPDPLEPALPEPKTPQTVSGKLNSLSAILTKDTFIIENTEYNISDIFYVTAKLSDSSIINVTSSTALTISADPNVACISGETIKFIENGNINFSYKLNGITAKASLKVFVQKFIRAMPNNLLKSGNKIFAKGIDVSKYNKNIDFNKVKNAGASFVIIRTGYGDSLSNPNQIDPYFIQNIRNAKKAGLDVGAYHFSYAASVNAAIREAQSMIDIVKNCQLEYPLYFDFEGASDAYLEKIHLGKPNRAELTNRAVAFMETLYNNGYYPGIYLNRDFYVNRYDMSQILGTYAIWLADWSNDTPAYSCGLHQTEGSDGRWPGVSGPCDIDSSYYDYPTDIKNMGFNGYTKKKSLASVTAIQNPETVLLPGKEYNLTEVINMLNITGELSDGSAADLSAAEITLSDPNIEYGNVTTAKIENGKFTIGENGKLQLSVTLDGITQITNVSMHITPSLSGQKASLRPVPDHPQAMKGQFILPLTKEQQAQITTDCSVSFDYYVQKDEIMHLFQVYHTEGEFMSAKGNGFFITQGRANLKPGSTMGTPDAQFDQIDNWELWNNHTLVATVPAPSRDQWHKVTINYKDNKIGVFVDNKQIKITGIGSDKDGYLNTIKKTIKKIGPIGTQQIQKPTLNSGTVLNPTGLTGDDSGNAYYDNFTIKCNDKNIYANDCNGNTKDIQMVWQIKNMNNGYTYSYPALSENDISDIPIPIFDYTIYNNSSNSAVLSDIEASIKSDIIIKTDTTYLLTDLFNITPKMSDGTNADLNDGILTASASADIAKTSGENITFLKSGNITLSFTMNNVKKGATIFVKVPPRQYNLTIQVNRGGKIIQGVSGQYPANKEIPIAVKMNSSRYRFKRWISNNGGTFENFNASTTKFTMPANDVTILAAITRKKSSGSHSSGGGGYSGSNSNHSNEDSSETTIEKTKYGINIFSFSKYESAYRLHSALKQLNIYSTILPYKGSWSVNVMYYSSIDTANALHLLLSNNFYSPVHTNWNKTKYGINVYPFTNYNLAKSLSSALSELNIYHIFETRNGAYQLRIEWYSTKNRANALNYILSKNFYNEIYAK